MVLPIDRSDSGHSALKKTGPCILVSGHYRTSSQTSIQFPTPRI